MSSQRSSLEHSKPPILTSTSATPSQPLKRTTISPATKAPTPRSYIVAALVLAFAAVLFALRAPGSNSPSTLNSPTSTASTEITTTMSTATVAASEPAFTPTYGKNGSFKDWNRLADGMERFHSHFKWEYDNTYKNADKFQKNGMNLQRFLREAEQVSHHLDMHHRIEEAYIFPLLAKKMPAFRDGAREKGEHIISHRGIHDGLTKYDKYISEAKANPASYDAEKLREIMDGFREVLFTHLEHEVRDLGAESMQKHGFTLAELKRFPM